MRDHGVLWPHVPKAHPGRVHRASACSAALLVTLDLVTALFCSLLLVTRLVIPNSEYFSPESARARRHTCDCAPGLLLRSSSFLVFFKIENERSSVIIRMEGHNGGIQSSMKRIERGRVDGLHNRTNKHEVLYHSKLTSPSLARP